MSIVVKPYFGSEHWMAALGELLPDEQLHLWPDVGEPGEVEFVLAWLMSVDDLAALTNLRAIFSLGAGVDQWRKLAAHPDLADVDVVRLADPAMAGEMAAYSLHWVIHVQRSFDQAEDLQRQGRFEQLVYTPYTEYPVGILGFGAIGARIGRAFTDLGYPVNAWTRTRPSDDRVAAAGDVTWYTGSDGLDALLSASSAVINVLPNTDDTKGLLSPQRLAAFRPGSLFVNIGRGTVLDERDLLSALDHGRPGMAVLDVTSPEPPDPSSPLFTHPKIVLTGHSAGMTNIATASKVVAANIKRLRRGESAFPLLDPERGY